MRGKTLDIVEVIRKLRNDLINDFLDEKNLIAYLSEQYFVMELSAVKIEFIKADLKRMRNSPVDTEWYKPIIEEFKATGSAKLAGGNEKLFFAEIDRVLIGIKG